MKRYYLTYKNCFKFINKFYFFRFGRPEEIGSIISFLCSSASSYITGEIIVASGGMTSRL